MHTRAHAHAHTHTHTHTYTHTHTHTHTHSHTHKHTHSHTHIHTHKHARTHTRTHAHIHTLYILAYVCVSYSPLQHTHTLHTCLCLVCMFKSQHATLRMLVCVPVQVTCSTHMPFCIVRLTRHTVYNSCPVSLRMRWCAYVGANALVRMCWCTYVGANFEGLCN